MPRDMAQTSSILGISKGVAIDENNMFFKFQIRTNNILFQWALPLINVGKKNAYLISIDYQSKINSEKYILFNHCNKMYHIIS